MQRPARVRFLLDAGELGFGHAGIMLERHLGDGAVLIAHRADEADDGADIAAARFERGDLGADVEIFKLHADHLSLR